MPIGGLNEETVRTQPVQRKLETSARCCRVRQVMQAIQLTKARSTV